ncbi:MAG: hypothetical protein CME70_15710 [Halobacteriovorax sp.]|nr:hypothetical protein [Halobacteriovorax sp.]|tara:strand:- start:5196 stop:6353 length:1158 start_codon:yes stop_codon:yes gene_type:complete
MKTCACLLNTTELGGAERSFITQLGILNSPEKFDIYFPKIEGLKASEETLSFVKSNGLDQPKGFKYNSDLYKTSRSSKKVNLINVLLGMLEQVLTYKVEGFLKYKNIWCNGNKVFIPLFLSAIVFGYEGRILWHLRDYPEVGRLNKLIKFLYRYFAKFNLVLIGNSDSTVSAFKDIFTDIKALRIYNPVINENKISPKDSIKVLGFAGMSVPWKGLHELYLWASLYEKELKDLGVEKILVFGKNIYHTKGEHSDYEAQLNRLKKLFKSSLIEHKGLVSPQEIYSSIDLMLHLSNRAEPFGRVILESFSQSIPCISTGLGGAGELMTNNTGLLHFNNDYDGLYQKVRLLIEDASFKNKEVQAGYKTYQFIQESAESDLFKLESLYF